MTIQGAQDLRTSHSTAPLRECARSERIEVAMMVAAEVPTAMWAYCAFSPPIRGRTTNRAGTTTKPPPIPNSPAAKPASKPAASMASRGTIQDEASAISGAIPFDLPKGCLNAGRSVACVQAYAAGAPASAARASNTGDLPAAPKSAPQTADRSLVAAVRGDRLAANKGEIG